MTYLQIFLIIICGIVIFSLIIATFILCEKKIVPYIKQKYPKKPYYESIYVRHIVGLGISHDCMCILAFDEDKIYISQLRENRVIKTFNIENSKIKSMEEDVIVEKRLMSGDSAGNALLGGILFGGVGAIVGSNIGNNIKDIKKEINVFNIKYISNNEDKTILLSCESDKDYNRFIKEYNNKILNKNHDNIEQINL